jgi:rSAM/selenodomain-associated transferase 2
MAPTLSIAIPTLNAAPHLEATLRSLAPGIHALSRRSLNTEIIVVDGGSADETEAVARKTGVHFTTAPRGRGQQLCAGAEKAAGTWLLFLHADTHLADGWQDELHTFVTDHENKTRAGVFRFALDDQSVAARALEHWVRWRCRLLALPYGDQGLLIHRTQYGAIGGFRPLPLMEDVDIVRRIGRRNLVLLRTAATTSAVRYRRAGYLPRMLRNASCLSLFYLGVRPETLVRLYG